MKIFQRFDPFFVIQGRQPIVVAAPHHGTRPNVDSDIGTGPIALALADRLNARAVIVSDLRRTVDVNKNPLDIQKSARHHALRYQNEIFCNLPRLIIEIHGHVSGHYPVELTTGFDLDPALPGDALFLGRLRKLKQILPTQLGGKIGQSVDLGIYPIDRDVKNAATNTYTFQKVRRARNRVGVEWYSLHIELAADLRAGKRAKAPGYIDAMAEAFAVAIQSAFEPLPGPKAVIPTHADMADDELVMGIDLQVVKAPKDSAGKNIVLLHSKEISILGLLEGDLIPLYNHGEKLHVPTSVSSLVPLGKIAIPGRLRRQLDLNVGESVTVIRSAPETVGTAAKNYQSFVIGEIRREKSIKVWMHPIGLQHLRAEPKNNLRSKGPFSISNSVPVQLFSDERLPERVIVATDALMQKLTLTIGEILMIEVNA